MKQRNSGRKNQNMRRQMGQREPYKYNSCVKLKPCFVPRVRISDVQICFGVAQCVDDCVVAVAWAGWVRCLAFPAAQGYTAQNVSVVGVGVRACVHICLFLSVCLCVFTSLSHLPHLCNVHVLYYIQLMQDLNLWTALRYPVRLTGLQAFNK